MTLPLSLKRRRERRRKVTWICRRGDHAYHKHGVGDHKLKMADDGCLGNKTSCACKGIRTCLVCEVSDARTISKKQEEEEEREEYFVCCNCGRTCLVGGARSRPLSLEPSCLSLECTNMSSLVVPDHLIGNEDIPFGGVTIVKNFISEKEEAELVSLIDSVQWVESQSGRRKQVRQLTV